MRSSLIERIRRVTQVAGLAALGVICSVHLASATQTLAQMYHTSWTVREGAPRNINMIAQTRDGFLWLGTDSGLFRFDGHSFDRYQPQSGESFPDDSVRRLAASADGGLWISYSRGGASFLKRGYNKNYGESAGLGRDTISQIVVDFDNTVWVGTGDGIKRLVGTAWEAVGQEWGFPAKTAAISLVLDRRGTLWVGTHDGLWYLRKAEHTFRSVPESAREVFGIAEAPDGTLWLGSENAPIRALDPVSATLRRDTAPINIHAETLNVARDGSLWIATLDRGIFRVQSPESPVPVGDRKENAFDHFAKQDGLSSNYGYQVLEDREGGVWIATTAGLDQFRPKAFTVLPVPEGMEIPAMAAADSGRFFYGAALVEASSGRILTPAPGAIREIFAMYRDADNALWLGGLGKLWKMSGGTFSTIELPSDLGSGRRVQSITADASGGLWVSIARNGVYRLFKGQWSKVTALEAAPDNLCLSIIVDSRGRIWSTFVKPNQVQVLEGEKVTTYGENEGIDVGVTTAIAEIDGRIVVGGKGGLEVLDGSRFRRLRLAGNQPISDVTGILRQKSGDLWVNQASGIVRIEASDFQSALANPDPPMRFRLFDYLDGVEEQSLLPAPLPSIHDGGDGLLYFSMRTQVLVLDTTHLPRNTLRPAVAIQSLVSDSKEFRNPANAALLPNTERVAIRYAASSLLIPQRAQFRYRLIGFDQAWQEGNAQRLAVYSRLPPGHYEFHVIASNNDGVWNEEGASVKFTIPPSFVQSLGFRVLCVALAAALLWLVYRIRLQQITVQMRRRLYERLDERMQIARDLHDTFFQGIQGLLLRFNTATAMLKQDEPARAILDETLRQSDLVMLEGREIMLDLRGGISKTTALAEQLSLFGDNCKKTHPADFRVAVIGDPRALHPIAFEEIHRFGREALSNAFRHAHARTIEAELHYERNLLRLRVRDDGVGIDSEILSRGSKAGHWGLPGMRERAKKLGGTVEMWSRANAGTEIELRVPAAAAYASRKRSWFGWLTRITSNDDNPGPR